MPLLENSLYRDDLPGDHTYQMLTWQGTPVRASQEIEQIKRAGLNTDAYRRLGIHAPPCTLTSVVDCPSHAAALVAYNAYLALKDGDPVKITKNDIDWGWYVVKDVVIVSAPAVHNMVGGLNSPSEVELTCRWTLYHHHDTPAP